MFLLNYPLIPIRSKPLNFCYLHAATNSSICLPMGILNLVNGSWEILILAFPINLMLPAPLRLSPFPPIFKFFSVTLHPNFLCDCLMSYLVIYYMFYCKLTCVSNFCSGLLFYCHVYRIPHVCMLLQKSDFIYSAFQSSWNSVSWCVFVAEAFPSKIRCCSRPLWMFRFDLPILFYLRFPCSFPNYHPSPSLSITLHFSILL